MTLAGVLSVILECNSQVFVKAGEFELSIEDDAKTSLSRAEMGFLGMGHCLVPHTWFIFEQNSETCSSNWFSKLKSLENILLSKFLVLLLLPSSPDTNLLVYITLSNQSIEVEEFGVLLRTSLLFERESKVALEESVASLNFFCV